jgi:hypothetical protein
MHRVVETPSGEHAGSEYAKESRLKPWLPGSEYTRSSEYTGELNLRLHGEEHTRESILPGGEYTGDSKPRWRTHR